MYRQLNALREFQKKENISESDHIRALEGLSYSIEQFDKMSNGVLSNPITEETNNNTTSSNKSKSDKHSFDKKYNTYDDNDEDSCKICFVNRIDCVMLPCGHFAVCSHCGM